MHYFGDRYEERCMVGGRKCWKIPVMEGEYIGEERFGTVKGIAGGTSLSWEKTAGRRSQQRRPEPVRLRG